MHSGAAPSLSAWIPDQQWEEDATEGQLRVMEFRVEFRDEEKVGGSLPKAGEHDWNAVTSQKYRLITKHPA